MPAEVDPRARGIVQQAFERLRGTGGDKLGTLANLFGDLNYEPVLLPLDVTSWPGSVSERIPANASARPQILSRAGRGGGFKVIYCPLERGRTQSAVLRLTDERAVAQQVLREEVAPDCLLVFSDPEQTYWHFVNPRLVTAREQQVQGRRQRYVLRRISVGPEDKLRTAIERFAMISLADAEAGILPPAEIHQKHDDAFNVEQVTDAFFREFKDRFLDLQDALYAATDDLQWAHDYALRLLSRIMFIYFIQRKGWLGDDPNFVANYWQTYLENRGRKTTAFLDDWLHPLFFEAFASPAEASLVNKRDYMPKEVRQALRNAPYLNGGLFSRDDLDRQHGGRYSIPDDYFSTLLDPQQGFFERYNFTISEDSPLDQEVAVDPEMIGRVYESLVNISEPGSEAAEDREEQRRAGIFYTPRTEIDLMCRLALSDYMRHHLGDEHRDLIYELVFAFEPDEKHEADEKAAALDLWPQLDELIRRVTVVDPACGSGSFLVGMMNILADLRARANEKVGRAQTDFDIKREIIRENLYGVDVMQWAVDIAELRLWLQLVVHTELEPGELQGPLPLLPNLSFKIRCGDSLVQEIGGVNLAHLKADADVPKSLKGELRKLKSRKLRFYDAKASDAEATLEREAIRQEERQLFLRILEAKADALQGRINEIDRMLSHAQGTLTGEAEAALSQNEQERLKAQRAEFEEQLARLKAARDTVLKARDVPFVWDMAFVEIFSGDEQGFDIVIGNPPYVRQEKIADPTQPYGEQTADDRKEYKARLERSAYQAFPKYFGNPASPRHKLSGRSDLYVYFYFHALSLLNSRGAFCFITSNSWLDVDYGAALQEFLARQVPIHMVLDNRVKRTFRADVNTIIALFGAPVPQRDGAVENLARFVMAQVPFEEMLHPVIFEEIDDAAERRALPEYRVFPITQRELLEAGMQAASEEEQPKRKRRRAGPLVITGRYEGDKWGGKYLRAPEIYYEILEAAGDKLVPLGEIAEVRRGFTTGANEFFYLPSRYFDVRILGSKAHLLPLYDQAPPHITLPASLLRPTLVRLSQASTPIADAEAASHLCLTLPASLAGPLFEGARQYVRWAEQHSLHKSATCQAREKWYALPVTPPAPVLLPRRQKRRPIAFFNRGGVLACDGLVLIYPHEPSLGEAIAASLCTTFSFVQREAFGTANFGQGVLETQKGEVPSLLVPNPATVSKSALHRLAEAFRVYAKERTLMVYDDVRRGAREGLDRSFLHLVAEAVPANWVSALHDAACRMVWQRMAKSTNSREARQTYDEWLASGEPFDPAAGGQDLEDDQGEDES